MPRNSRSGSDPGEEMATVFPLRSASVLISALARTTCGTPGQVQPTIFTPVPRMPATIDSAAPMSTLSISPEISAFIRVAPAFICRSSTFSPRFAAKPPLSTIAMKPASLLASRMPCFQTFSCAWAAVRLHSSAHASVNIVCILGDANMNPPVVRLVMPGLGPSIPLCEASKARRGGPRQASLDTKFPAALATLIDAEEQIFEPGPLSDQTLLVRVANQGFQDVSVALGEPVLPRIRPKDALLFPPRIAIPGQRHDALVHHALHCDIFCFVESLEEIHREPRVLVRQLLAKP